MTQQQADWLLEDVIDPYYSEVHRCAPKATAAQLGSMTSLAYNIGIGAFKSSTVLRETNAGNIAAAADAFLLWDKSHVDGRLVEVAGLLRRRQAERGVFLSVPPAPSDADALNAAELAKAQG